MRALALLIVALLIAAPASAADVWTFSVGVGSDFPISTGFRGVMHTSPGFEVFGTFGTMPDLYLTTLNDIVVGLGGYDREVAALVEQSLGNSVVMTIGGAIPLFAGVKLRGAYGMVGLGGNTALSNIAELAVSEPLPIPLNGQVLSATSSLQIMTAGFAGNIQFMPYMGLHLGAGAAFTIGSSTTIETNDPALNTLTQDYLSDAEEYLDDIFTTYGHSPFVSMYLYFNL